MLSRACADIDPSHVFTGGAHGFDTIAAYWAAENMKMAEHIIIHPKHLHWNHELAKVDFKLRPVLGDYMDRNDVLVRDADILIAYPSSCQEVIRSGTWATVRRARKRDI